MVKGQTASSSYKPAKLENGVRVMVPPHVGSGTRIVINTRRRDLRRNAPKTEIDSNGHSFRRHQRDGAKAADKAARALKRDFGEVSQLQVSMKGTRRLRLPPPTTNPSARSARS